MALANMDLDDLDAWQSSDDDDTMNHDSLLSIQEDLEEGTFEICLPNTKRPRMQRSTPAESAYYATYYEDSNSCANLSTTKEEGEQKPTQCRSKTRRRVCTENRNKKPTDNLKKNEKIQKDIATEEASKQESTADEAIKRESAVEEEAI